jgi:hypothetical protein
VLATSLSGALSTQGILQRIRSHWESWTCAEI